MDRSEKLLRQQFNLEQALKHFFGHTSFREGQREIIESILNGHHTLATLPTGSGKSICYQLPSLLLDGLTVIVSPLISLMVDQVKLLKYKGIKQVAAINSLLDSNQKKMIMNQLNRYKLIYCSPEMLQQSFFIEQLQNHKVSLFVIDEAHCISQWGHEFRPDYLRLKQIIQRLNEPTVLALSATATPDIQRDIINQLNIEMKSLIYPMDRTNITYNVLEVSNDHEKRESLLQLLQNIKVPTMIYFSSRTVSENISLYLREKLENRKIGYYHGGMSQEDRILIQQQFMQGQLDIICCTSAFGMGINKDNIRFVIHYHLPSNLESFIQESGRAGRDGEHSVSLLLYAKGDENIPFQLIDNELPNDQIIDTYIHAKLRHQLNDLVIEGMTETHERFLSYQLEQINDKVDWEIISSEIKLIRDQRLDVKKRSIMKIISWVHDQHCRRVNLFKPFQKVVRKPVFECCDQCGFNLSKWKPKEMENKGFSYDWKIILKEMFNK